MKSFVENFKLIKEENGKEKLLVFVFSTNNGDIF